MKVGAVIGKRVLSNGFVGKRIFDGEVQCKGTWDIPRSRVVAVGGVGRGRVERNMERITRGSWIKSNHIGRGVFSCCSKFLLEHPFLAIPEHVVTISPIKNLKEGATWVALSFVEVLMIEVTKNELGIHVDFVEVVGREEKYLQ